MSTNKDLVSEAISAIPQWIAFLDQKEAEQDALIEQMQNGEPKTLMQRATGILNKGPKNEIVDEASTRTSDEDTSGQPPVTSDSDTHSIDTNWAPVDLQKKEEQIEKEQIEEEQKGVRNMY